jgi:polyisoprenoid-binding protein YceI
MFVLVHGYRPGTWVTPGPERAESLELVRRRRAATLSAAIPVLVVRRPWERNAPSPDPTPEATLRAVLRPPRRALGLFWLASAALAVPAAAEEQTLTLDPAATTIAFTLGATLHSIEGTVRLASGAIRFDPVTGAASGEIDVDARSATTGLGSRDENMHGEVLESEKYPRIAFRAERLRVVHRDAAGAVIELVGQLDLHGRPRPYTLPAKLAFDGDRVAIEAKFRVPYVDWGMQDYSTFILRVDRFVDVRVASAGRIGSP